MMTDGTRPLWFRGGLVTGLCDAMVQLVMFECAQDADADLRGQMAEVRRPTRRRSCQT